MSITTITEQWKKHTVEKTALVVACNTKEVFNLTFQKAKMKKKGILNKINKINKLS